MLVGEDNFVQIEQDGEKITTQNGSGSFVILEGNNIETNCKGDKKYTTGTTQWENKGDFNLNTALFNVTSKGNATISGTTVSVETPVFNLQAGDVQLSPAAARAIAALVDPYITHP